MPDIITPLITLFSFGASIYSIISGIHFGKQQKTILNTIRKKNDNIIIHQLEHGIFYCPSIKIINTKSKGELSITDKDVKQILTSIKTKLKSDIFSYRLLTTPGRMQKMIINKPEEVLFYRSNIENLRFNENQSLIPIYIHDKNIVGWQSAWNFPLLFNCEIVSPLNQINTISPYVYDNNRELKIDNKNNFDLYNKNISVDFIPEKEKVLLNDCSDSTILEFSNLNVIFKKCITFNTKFSSIFKLQFLINKKRIIWIITNIDKCRADKFFDQLKLALEYFYVNNLPFIDAVIIQYRYFPFSYLIKEIINNNLTLRSIIESTVTRSIDLKFVIFASYDNKKILEEFIRTLRTNKIDKMYCFKIGSEKYLYNFKKFFHFDFDSAISSLELKY